MQSTLLTTPNIIRDNELYGHTFIWEPLTGQNIKFTYKALFHCKFENNNIANNMNRNTLHVLAAEKFNTTIECFSNIAKLHKWTICSYWCTKHLYRHMSLYHRQLQQVWPDMSAWVTVHCEPSRWQCISNTHHNHVSSQRVVINDYISGMRAV